jgi:hypothetical protein
VNLKKYLVINGHTYKSMVEQPFLCGLTLPILYIKRTPQGILCGLDTGNEADLINTSHASSTQPFNRTNIQQKARVEFLTQIQDDSAGLVLQGTSLELAHIASELMEANQPKARQHIPQQVERLLKQAETPKTFDPFEL